MRRLIVLLLLLVLPVTACTFEFQTFPQAGDPTQTPSPGLAPVTEGSAPGNEQNLEGPNINYKGIRFTLDPALGSRVYAFDEEITLEGATAHYTRFALNPEEYCQTWCLMIYPISEFEQNFGSFVFPPAGYRGGRTLSSKRRKNRSPFKMAVAIAASKPLGRIIMGSAMNR